jgi:hypothetical protein
MIAGAAGDAIRKERRSEHRVPGRRARADRSPLRARVDLQRRVRVARAAPRGLPHAPCVILPPHPLRQARHRALRPRTRQRAPDAGGADGRRASRARRHRLRARRPLRRLRGREPVHAVRCTLSAAHARAHHLRWVRQAPALCRLPVGPDARGPGTRLRRDRARMGRTDRAGEPRAERGGGSGVRQMVGHLPEAQREPSRRRHPAPDEYLHRHAAGPPHGARPHARDPSTR